MNKKLALIHVIVFAGFPVSAFEPVIPQIVPIKISDPLPYGQSPIDYFHDSSQTSIDKLQRRLSSEVELQVSTPAGYLQSLLKELAISSASQMLVFSKTALNPKLVSPQTPRAMYFNDETYVAWVPGSRALEIAAVDPKLGWVFYTLSQPKAGEKNSRPAFKREIQCLACHAGQSTLRVPGGLVRAFVTDSQGNPQSGYSRVTHAMPFEKRFGGWYVTGTHGRQTHRGNIIDPKSSPAAKLMPSPNNVAELSGVFDASRYLSPHSDLVAQLVFHHQIHGQNLLIRVAYESRFGRRSDAEDRLVRYLLFAEEAPLTEPVEGSSKFTREFPRQGKRDPQGRSLREWDLKTRLFKYRLSYLIETPLFDGLPREVKQRIYGRLWEILAVETPPKPFDQIPRAERQAILEIVSHLKSDLPKPWQQHQEKIR